MFENYLKVAVRNLLRQKGYSLINVTGLAVGMACCLLIAIFVRNEWSYDTFHEKGDRIYRVALNRLYPNHTGKFAITQAPIAPTLVRDFPEVVEGTRIFNIGGTTQISYKEQ